MSDYISREELLKAVDTWDKFGCDANTKLVPIKDCYVPYVHYDDIIHSIKAMPSADVRENVHGHWEPKYPTREETIYCQERYFCSNCKDYVVDRIARLEFKFCPNCGAKMDKGVSE